MIFKRTAIATLIAAMLVSNPVVARSLENELQSMLNEHPTLRSARKAVQVSDKGRDAATSGYYPRVSISGDTGKEKIETSSANTNLNRRKLAASVEQNLFSGGRTVAGVDIAEIDYAAQNNTLSATTQDLLLEGITAYMQVARYQTLIAIARRNEETTLRQLSLENQRVERGGGIAVDVMQARTRLQLVKERRVFYEQGLRDTVANYHQVFGHAPELAGMQELDIFTARIPKSLDDALDQGRDKSPRMKEAFLQSKKAQKQIGVERSGMFPTIDLVGTRGAETNVNAIPKRDETSVLLRFNWNLFAGFETTNRTDAASLQHQVLLDREVAVTNKTEEAIRIAWNQLINGREREELLESAANLSYDVMQNRKRLRDAGKEAAINVLDAEVEYYAVLSNKLNATTDTRLGSYRLLAAIGALTPEALGLRDGKFALPVKPLSLEVGKLDVNAVAPVTNVQPVKQVPINVAEREVVLQTVNDWAKAWSTQDVNKYLDSYSKDFKTPDGRSRQAWADQRRSRIIDKRRIQITVEAPTVTVDGDTAALAFHQIYQSDRFTEHSNKILILNKQDGKWKIQEERTAP